MQTFDFYAGVERGTEKLFGVMGDFLPVRIFQSAGEPRMASSKRQNARVPDSVAHGEPLIVPSQRNRFVRPQLALGGEFRSEITSSTGAAAAAP